jgi:hypothetical protein
MKTLQTDLHEPKHATNTPKATKQNPQKDHAHLQMAVAAAIVSQLERFRTRLLSASMRCTLKASARVTARGRPSGTATTSRVMLVMKNDRYSCKMTSQNKVIV